MGGQHTQGPWSACKNGDCQCGFIWSACGNVHLASAHDDHALGQDYFGSDMACLPETRAANARLIAAAPELLDVAERALAFINSNAKTAAQHLALTAELRAAIAKATGAPA